MLCQIFPCRALMIRAVPNISVPCPHDPCPDLASRNMGPFFVGKKRLRQRTHKLGASKNMGAVNICKATGFSRIVQKWNMHFLNALNCEANAQGPLN